MTRRQLAASAAAAGLLLTSIVVGHDPRASRRATPPGVVEQPATSTQLAQPERVPSVLRPATRAIRWQLAAETGTRQTPPARTFTTELDQQLTSRPPRPATAGTHGRLLGIRETQPVPGARRVLATIRRGKARSQVTLVLVCRRQCLVASIE